MMTHWTAMAVATTLPSAALARVAPVAKPQIIIDVPLGYDQKP